MSETTRTSWRAMNARGVPWLSTEDAVQHLRVFPNVKAFLKFIARLPADKRPRKHYVGRQLLFRQTDLDALIESTPAVASAPLRVLRGGR